MSPSVVYNPVASGMAKIRMLLTFLSSQTFAAIHSKCNHPVWTLYHAFHCTTACDSELYSNAHMANTGLLLAVVLTFELNVCSKQLTMCQLRLREYQIACCSATWHAFESLPVSLPAERRTDRPSPVTRQQVAEARKLMSRLGHQMQQQKPESQQ